MKEIVKYRVISNEEETIIITEDGGIGAFRYSEEDGVETTTEYFQDRLTDDIIDMNNVWDILAEGKAYYNDWDREYKPEDDFFINDVLNWLYVGDFEFVRDDTIWSEFTEDKMFESTK